jgi:hypothetical protein
MFLGVFGNCRDREKDFSITMAIPNIFLKYGVYNMVAITQNLATCKVAQVVT